MIGFSYLVPKFGGAVEAYLTVIGIMDMPLFVVAIFYGLLWKHTTWQGALTGYLAGASFGGIAKFGLGYDFNTATFFSAGAALLVCPVISLLTYSNTTQEVEMIWNMRVISDEEKTSGIIYSVIPRTRPGKLFLGILLMGLALFLCGVITGSFGFYLAGYLAIAGMIIYFLGGLVRLIFD